MPGDSRYEQSDVVKDIDGVLATESNLLLSHWLEDGELDKNGKPYTKETIFSERIPNEFIKTRSTVLGGLMDGLSPLGKINASQKLHEGSGLSDYFWSTPVEAISKTLFARPNLIYEDVHRVLEPGENCYYQMCYYSNLDSLHSLSFVSSLQRDVRLRFRKLEYRGSAHFSRSTAKIL